MLDRFACFTAELDPICGLGTTGQPPAHGVLCGSVGDQADMEARRRGVRSLLHSASGVFTLVNDCIEGCVPEGATNGSA